MKDHRFAKIFKGIKLDGVWGELKAKEMFPVTIIYKIFETNSSFHLRWGTMGIV